MQNKVRILREEKNWTQTELAEKSGVSLRTVQRIESGQVLKGFSLRAIAKSLEISPEELFFAEENSANVSRAKMINFSALAGFVIPFGSIIFPLILTYKTKDSLNKELGKNIVSFQIILSGILSISMILSPFFQKYFSVSFPLFIIPLIVILCIKLMVVIINGISLNQKKDLYKKLKINFL